jgi:hypothetical protein
MEKQIGRSEGTGNFSGEGLNQSNKLMKTKIIIAFPAIAILVLCVAALSPSVKPLAPYEREQTKGNVRVVLLKIERATIFTSQNVRDAAPDKSYPVPVIGITYLVEALGNEPIKNWNVYSTGEEITIGGHKISEFDAALMPENLIPGGQGTTSPASGYGNRLGELPKSFDKKRSSVEELYVPSGSSQTGMTHLQLKAGFNDHPETFIFDNVPLN